MAASALKSMTVPAKSKHTATVIFAHGLGDSGSGWSFLAEQLGPKFPYIKWIFPDAPMIPITINNGSKMPGWFDLKSLKPPHLDDARAEDEEGIIASVNKIHDIVNQEAAHVPESRIVVGGFSQGAAVTLLTSLTTEKKLAGFASLSGYLPLNNKVPELRKLATQNSKVFMAHGTRDEVLQYSWGEMSYKFLKEKLEMPNVEFHTYQGMGHTANEEELRDFTIWLRDVLPPSESTGDDSKI